MQFSGALAERGLHAFEAEPYGSAGHAMPRIWAMLVEDGRAQIFRKTPQGMETIMKVEAKTEGAFVGKLAAWLDTVEREGIFDRLVLVAAPCILEGLHAALSQNVCARVAAEVGKDLAGKSVDDVKRCLEEILWF